MDKTTQQTVAELVNKNLTDGGGNAIREQVVKVMADAEKAARVEAFTTVLAKQKAAQLDVLKIKPDNILKDGTGKVVHELFTDPQWKKLSAAKELVNRLETALNNALDQNTTEAWAKVKELAKGGAPATPAAE